MKSIARHFIRRTRNFSILNKTGWFLLNRVLKPFISHLKRLHPDVSIYLKGGMSRGDQILGESDIDLVVIVRAPDPKGEFKLIARKYLRILFSKGLGTKKRWKCAWHLFNLQYYCDFIVIGYLLGLFWATFFKHLDFLTFFWIILSINELLYLSACKVKIKHITLPHIGYLLFYSFFYSHFLLCIRVFSPVFPLLKKTTAGGRNYSID